MELKKRQGSFAADSIRVSISTHLLSCAVALSHTFPLCDCWDATRRLRHDILPFNGCFPVLAHGYFFHFPFAMPRPRTAAEIWQHDFMCHALSRLYQLSTLSVEESSEVLTVVAQHHIGRHLVSGKRSTAAQLKEIFSEEGERLDPGKLRPQSDEQARERTAWWRFQRQYHRERATQLRRHDHVAPNPDPDDNGHQTAAADPPEERLVDETSKKQHVRLSWVKDALPHLSDSQCAEIRSILSWRSSLCSSTVSRPSSHHSQARPGPSVHHDSDAHANLSPLEESLVTHGADWQEIAPWTDISSRVDGTQWTDPPRPAVQTEQPLAANSAQYNRVVIGLCCRHRSECLHRKVSATLAGRDTPRLTPLDFLPREGRDVFGDTLLHLAARWATVDVFRTIHSAVDVRMVNLKNSSGDTFMHILAPLWVETQPKALLEVLGASCNQGFNFLARNLDGRNIFSSLLPPVSARIDAIQLRSLSNSMQYLVSETPSHILMPSLLSPAPGSQPATVAFYMETLLQAHARTITDYPSQAFALSVSRLFCDKAAAFPWTNSLPLIPTVNGMHNYLKHVLSVTPWEAASDTSGLSGILNGADPNEYDMHGTTAMPCVAAVLHHIGLGHLADKDGVPILDLLCQHGADLRLVTSDGETPLHMAIRLCLPHSVAALLKLGADPMAYNLKGIRAMDYALLQKALQKDKMSDRKLYARAHRVLACMVDVAVKLKLPRPHLFFKNQHTQTSDGR